MRIKRVVATNLKVPRLDYELAPVNVIVGKSEAGKTAVLNAIRVTLLGHEPKLKKTNARTFKLSRGGKLSVGLTLDDGTELARSFEQERDSVTATCNEAAEAFSCPPMLFDLGEYFRMTVKERIAHIFSLCKLAPEEGHGAILSLLRTMQPELAGEHVEAAIAAVVETATELWTAAEEEGVSLQDWIASLATELGEQCKAANKALKTMTGYVEAEAQLRALQWPGSEPVQSREQELEKWRGEAQKLQSGINAAMEQIRVRNGFIVRLDEIRQAILANAADPAVGFHLEPLPPKVSDEELQQAEDLELKIDAETNRRAVLNDELSGLKPRKYRLEQSLKNLDDEIAKQVVQAGEYAHMEACPYCKSKSKGWRAHLLNDLAEASKRTTDARKATEAGLAPCLELLTSVAHQITDIDDSIAKMRAIIKGTVARCSAYNAVVAANADAQRAKDAHEKKLAGYRGEEKAIMDSMPPEISQKHMNEMRELQQTEASHISALQTNHNHWLKLKAAEANLATAKLERDRCEARAVVLKLATETVFAQQERLLQSSIGALMAKANIFLEGVLPYPLEYRDGDFCYQDSEGAWATHETFSGTRTALAFAGLAVALAAESPIRLIMIDELGIMSPETKLAMLKRLYRLVLEGKIDQVVTADSNSRDWLPLRGEEWINVIEVAS